MDLKESQRKVEKLQFDQRGLETKLNLEQQMVADLKSKLAVCPLLNTDGLYEITTLTSQILDESGREGQEREPGPEAAANLRYD